MQLKDELIRTLSTDGAVSLRVLTATNLVRDAVARHRTSPTASVALGRALTGGLLLATEAQRGERLQILIRGDGPIGGITVTADSGGQVRGYVQHPGIDTALRGEELGVRDAVGFGTPTIERMHADWKHPYNGIVPLVSGEIAQDLARYLLESEQKPSAIALGIYLGAGGEVQAASGYLIQALPGADDQILGDFERRVAATPNPSQLVREGASADQLLEQLFGDLGHGEIERVEPRFHCPCSPERVRQAATLLGREEVQEMVESGETLEVRCAFCAEVYRMAPERVASAMLDS